MIGNAAKPKQQISIENGKWTIITSTTVSKVTLEFELDKEFEETTADGRKVMVRDMKYLPVKPDAMFNLKKRKV